MIEVEAFLRDVYMNTQPKYLKCRNKSQSHEEATLQRSLNLQGVGYVNFTAGAFGWDAGRCFGA